MSVSPTRKMQPCSLHCVLLESIQRARPATAMRKGKCGTRMFDSPSYCSVRGLFKGGIVGHAQNSQDFVKSRYLEASANLRDIMIDPERRHALVLRAWETT